jgi:hypothetical protein
MHVASGRRKITRLCVPTKYLFCASLLNLILCFSSVREFGSSEDQRWGNEFDAVSLHRCRHCFGPTHATYTSSISIHSQVPDAVSLHRCRHCFGPTHATDTSSVSIHSQVADAVPVPLSSCRHCFGPTPATDTSSIYILYNVHSQVFNTVSLRRCRHYFGPTPATDTSCISTYSQVFDAVSLHSCRHCFGPTPATDTSSMSIIVRYLMQYLCIDVVIVLALLKLLITAYINIF